MRKKMDRDVDLLNPNLDEYVQCQGDCGKTLPLTDNYFHKDPTRETGFNAACKVCRAEERRVRKGQELLESVEELEQRGIDKLAEHIEFNDVSGCAHSATTFEDTLTIFGGSQGFARHLYGQYLQCKPGSAQRTRVLTLIVTWQMKLTEAGHAEKQLDKMSDDQLQAELQKALKIHQPPAAIKDVG